MNHLKVTGIILKVLNGVDKFRGLCFKSSEKEWKP